MSEPLPATPEPTAAPTERTTPDRSVRLLVAAAALVVAVVAAVLVFGVDRPPALERLAAEPALTPPGSIVWSEWRQDEQCLMAADPQGTVREVLCDLDGGEPFAWTDEGIYVHGWFGGGDRTILVDPETGATTTLEEGERGFGPSVYPRTRREAGTLNVAVDGDGRRSVVWEVEAPASYDVVSAASSPDGSMVALIDTADRLLVVPADGSQPPRVWAEGVPRYMTLVWEGTEPAS